MLLPTEGSARWNRSGMLNEEPSGGYRLPERRIDTSRGHGARSTFWLCRYARRLQDAGRAGDGKAMRYATKAVGPSSTISQIQAISRSIIS